MNKQALVIRPWCGGLWGVDLHGETWTRNWLVNHSTVPVGLSLDAAPGSEPSLGILDWAKSRS